MLTSRVAVRSAFTIVHEVALKGAEHVPLELYPAGIGVSVAVQLGSPTYPLTVKRAGRPSLAGADAGSTVPLAQLRLTVTFGPPLGW